MATYNGHFEEIGPPGFYNTDFSEDDRCAMTPDALYLFYWRVKRWRIVATIEATLTGTFGSYSASRSIDVEMHRFFGVGGDETGIMNQGPFDTLLGGVFFANSDADGYANGDTAERMLYVYDPPEAYDPDQPWYGPFQGLVRMGSFYCWLGDVPNRVSGHSDQELAIEGRIQIKSPFYYPFDSKITWEDGSDPTAFFGSAGAAYEMDVLGDGTLIESGSYDITFKPIAAAGWWSWDGKYNVDTGEFAPPPP